jgi:hypothetical protein
MIPSSWLDSKRLRLLRWSLWLPAMVALLIGAFGNYTHPPKWFWIILIAFSSLNLVLLELQQRLRTQEAKPQALTPKTGDGKGTTQ